MAAITFDRLKFVDRLKHSGVSEKQAKAFSNAFRDAQLEIEFATKQDINILKQDINGLKKELEEVEKRLTSQLTIRFGSMLFGGLTLTTTIIVTLMKFV